MIAVTGATGFVGRALVRHFEATEVSVRPLVRRSAGLLPAEMETGDINELTDWTEALRGVRCVIHCAARVHMLNDAVRDPLQVYRQINVAGTRKLAEDAVRAGVRRLVFVSTVKVMGEFTKPSQPFSVDDQPRPQGAYAQSKWEAEQALWQVASQSGLEVVVIRPPLVYGPGVKANFERLMTWVEHGWPLPLGAVKNRRSMVALDNLVDLVALCSHHPQAAGNTFLVSDGQDQSTPELICSMALALGKKPRLCSVPTGLLRIGGFLIGQTEAMSRLLDSLQVNIDNTQRQLQWRPPMTSNEALRRLVASKIE